MTTNMTAQPENEYGMFGGVGRRIYFNKDVAQRKNPGEGDVVPGSLVNQELERVCGHEVYTADLLSERGKGERSQENYDQYLDALCQQGSPKDVYPVINEVVPGVIGQPKNSISTLLEAFNVNTVDELEKASVRVYRDAKGIIYSIEAIPEFDTTKDGRRVRR